MKKGLVILSIAIVVFSIPFLNIPKEEISLDIISPRIEPSRFHVITSSSGEGLDSESVMYFSKEIASKSLTIFNSYSNPNTHTGILDLSEYLMSGYTLYKTEIDANTITAAPECETTGITANDYIRIRNDSGLVTDALYQEFYNQPHDGKLENYTITYISTYYSSSLGEAYLVVRSDYSDKQTNMTGYTTPFAQVLSDTDVTHDVSSENAILDSNAPYYVVIDGTDLIGQLIIDTWYFNRVYWVSSSSTLGDETGYHLRNDNWYTYSGISRQEADLEYTYTPWNKTSSSALVYDNAEDVTLVANSSSLSGTSWEFTSSNNITALDFSSTQSVIIDYNVTLWYKKTVPTQNNWSISNPGSNVDWNSTISVTFPSIALSKHVNLSKQESWTPIGLYNSTNPSIDYGNYIDYSSSVSCSKMTNGTWTLASSGFNHVTSVELFDESSGSPVEADTSILTNVEINSTIQDNSSLPAESSSTNLTIWKSGLVIWAPANETVSSGKTSYLWDIDSFTSDNGLYTIEVYWANGTQAGYNSIDLVVFYPTSLTPSQLQIDAYTEDTFPISVYFEDTATPQGLDGAYAAVEYSFDGGMNTSMTDHGNGTWTASVSTTGKNPGFYTVEVFAKGYALENQTTTLNVSLIHKTQTLNVIFSNTNNITYVEDTVLTVTYRRVNGINVTGAMVNVTIGSDIWQLQWHASSQTYRLRFNGSDIPPGFGTHSLNIQAWRAGYLEQSDTTNTLTVNEEPTSIEYEWSNTDTISYVDSTVLYINFTMSNGTAVTGAEVNATIGTTTWLTNWDLGSSRYYIQFDGDDSPPGLGSHVIDVNAWLYGYQAQLDSSQTLTINEETTLSLISFWDPSSTITYADSAFLYVNYWMSNGSAITNAQLNMTIDSNTWPLYWYQDNQAYRIQINGSDNPPDLGTHSISISAWRHGFESKSDSTSVTLTQEPTTITTAWSNTNSPTYFDSSLFFVYYRMTDSTPITGAMVNVTSGLDVWSMTWNGTEEAYQVRFNGSDNPPGVGTHNLTVNAWRYGFQDKTDSSDTLTLPDIPTDISISWTDGSSITFVEQTTLHVNYSDYTGVELISATVNVTIGGNTWDLVWNGVLSVYEYTFYGSDSPPGLGTHSLTVNAWQSEYVGQSDSDETLEIVEESTSLSVVWLNSDNITYVEQTLLSVQYLMSNSTPIDLGTLNATINGLTKALSWHALSESYRATFYGNEDPPGLGTHAVTILAWKFGYESRNDSTESLTIREAETVLAVSWLNGNTISYVGETILDVSYELTNGTSITDATVNVTIDTTTWTLIWNGGSETYQVTFRGSDDPPGLGLHSLTVQAWKDKYTEQIDSSETLDILKEVTSIQIAWSDGSNITYVDFTILSVNYTMSNGTAISGAVVNATIGVTTWPLSWESFSSTYQLRFNGSDEPPGLGTHVITINTWKFGYESRSDSSETLTLRKAETVLVVSWLNGNSISYVGETTLDVSYELTNGSSIDSATVNVTIDTTTWTLEWNGGTESYQRTFRGTDDPPGLGTYSLTIQAWRDKYTEQLDSSEILVIHDEVTTVYTDWSDGNSITYVESSTLSVNYTMSNGTAIAGATVNVTIESTTWVMSWDLFSMTYQLQFNGTDNLPGLGTHGLAVRAWKFGFEYRTNGTITLSISGELGSVDSKWLGLDNITYVETTTLQVNYTMGNGTAIPSAWVNVTIDVTTWDLTWHSASSTYRLMFNGTDSPPGFGTHALTIKAWRSGFDNVTDSSLDLTLREEETSLTIDWFHTSVITYFGFTTLRVSFLMRNGSPITDAVVNVTIGIDLWLLTWNDTTGYFEKIFLGSDDPPGLGTHPLFVQASRFGYGSQTDSTETLTLQKDPTTISVSWSPQNSISYIEHTLLIVVYEMSNETAIEGALVNVTIGVQTWLLHWNPAQSWYELQFNGTDSPPGLGTHSLAINASKTVFQEQTTSETLTISEDVTSVTSSWITEAIDWNQSVLIAFNFTDSSGLLISDATQKSIRINETLFSLQGNNGTYWFELNNSIDLGYHEIEANFSKFGYTFSYISGISLDVVIANTDLVVSWSAVVIDYRGQADLTVDFQYTGTGQSVPWTGVISNITIDGATPVPMNRSGNLWTANLTGLALNLGSHNVLLKFWSYGYEYKENLTVLQVNEVTTDPLVVIWEPSNATVEYIDLLNLTVDYTFYGGDVPDTATVNVTIAFHTYTLGYVAGSWFGSLPADEIGIGIHQAQISAWSYGYTASINTTDGVNITAAANTFFVYWEPFGLDISYVETLNVTVIYTHDFSPVPGATVRLSINATRVYDFTFNPTDERWHLLLDADIIGLGVWNLTVRANQTGYDTGTDWEVITVNRDVLSVQPSWTDETTDYATPIELILQLNASDSIPVLDADVIVTILGSAQSMNHVQNGEYATTLGPLLQLGVHNINVTSTGSWFEQSTIWLTLNVTETGTILSLTFNSTSIYYDETVRVEIEYWMTNGSQATGFVSSALYVNDTPHTISWVVSYWIGLIEGPDYGIGNLVCFINTSSYGYESQNTTFILTVSEIPSAVLLPAQNWLYVNDSISLPITYRDARDNSTIQYDSIVIEWDSVYNITSSGSNSFSIEIHSIGLHAGWVSLNMSLTKTGYVENNSSIAIEVRALPMEVSVASVSQYESEDITITATVMDLFHNVPVHWATVELTFQGTVYSMIYSDGEFSTSFTLGSLEPGFHSIQVSAEALDCQDSSSTSVIEVLAKVSYTITLEVPTEVVRGGTLQVIATATQDTTPVSNLPIELHWQFTLNDQTVDEDSVTISTTSDGSAQYEISVPIAAQTIKIIASYEGSISEWTADSPEYDIQVIDDSPDILGFLQNPVTLTITLGFSSIIVVFILIRKSRSVATSTIAKAAELLTSDETLSSDLKYYWLKDREKLFIKDVLHPVSDSFGDIESEALRDSVTLMKLGLITPLSLEQQATSSGLEASITERAVKEIMSSKAGITRAELAHKLDLSNSKTRKLVKEILERNEEIIESRIGRKRVLIHEDPDDL